MQLSPFIDEYRIKYRITMDKIIGIGIPFDKNYIGFEEKAKQIIAIAQALNLDIVDSSDEYFIEKYEAYKDYKQQNEEKIRRFSL